MISLLLGCWVNQGKLSGPKPDTNVDEPDFELDPDPAPATEPSSEPSDPPDTALWDEDGDGLMNDVDCDDLNPYVAECGVWACPLPFCL